MLVPSRSKPTYGPSLIAAERIATAWWLSGFIADLFRHAHEPQQLSAYGHEGQFAPPKVSDRFAFSEETFAGRCGNEKDAPNADISLRPQERRQRAVVAFDLTFSPLLARSVLAAPVPQERE